jgi:hypothetical protein
VAEVQEALTQKRSKIKKLVSRFQSLLNSIDDIRTAQIGWSLKVNKTDETNGPDSEHQNIFTLAQNVVKGSQCTVNIVLCARIALMVCFFRYCYRPVIQYRSSALFISSTPE